MRVAYIISAYKHFDQLTRLVHRLHEPGVRIFIHVDRRSGPIDALQAATAHLLSVRFLERHSCPWGSFGHVAATLKGIDAAMASAESFDYLILLTGQDYPIKSNRQIRDVLEAAEGRSFMEFFPLPGPEWSDGGLDRIERWHVHTDRRHVAFPPRGWAFPRRRFPAGLHPFGGSSYWCLASDCVRYVHRFVTANARFVNFFRHVDVPDELFFQTILLNSPLRDRIVNDNLRYIDWRDPTSGSPAVLTSPDLPAMQASAKLFARKFDAAVDGTVLDLIDEELLQAPR
jgi:hypothetical protein